MIAQVLLPFIKRNSKNSQSKSIKISRIAQVASSLDSVTTATIWKQYSHILLLWSCSFSRRCVWSLKRVSRTKIYVLIKLFKNWSATTIICFASNTVVARKMALGLWIESMFKNCSAKITCLCYSLIKNNLSLHTFVYE